MLAVFEVYVAPGSDPEKLITPETQRETHAQVMTLEDARKVGFAGLEPAPHGGEVRLIAVAARDARWIQRALEGNEGVAQFRVHEVDG